MSSLDDMIRDSLRSEATRLREVRPLRLPPAAPRRGSHGPRARWRRPWQAPVAAVAAVVMVAAILVTLRSLRDEQPAAPAASHGITAGTVPRYFMAEKWVKDGAGKGGIGLAWAVTDAQTGKQAGYVPLPGFDPDAGEYLGSPVAAAADDRTFVAAEPVTRPGAMSKNADGQAVQGDPVLEALKWYRLRLSPGAADPLRLARLPLPSTAAFGPVTEMALSGDGTELAVAYRASARVTLRVYSVATGQVRHSWAVTVPVPASEKTGPFTAPFTRVTNLSWVGEATVAFAFASVPGARKEVREEVRTLSIDAPGASLLPASHAVWSLNVPLAAYANYGHGTSQACNSPFLSGNGRAVVCGTATYSAASRRLTTAWLAYPVAGPARPSVLARVQDSIPSADVPTLSPSATVEWVNASGTEIIGQWSHQTVTHAGTPNATWSSTDHTAVIGSGTVRLLPTGVGGDRSTAW
jgi:hypothetical protein